MLKKVTLLKNEMELAQSYPFSLPVVQNLEVLEFKKQVCFFVGENGSGKSTILEAIAHQCGFHTAGGGRNNTYEVSSSEAALGPHLRLSWMPKLTKGFFMRAESFYEFASHIDELGHYSAYGGRSLHKQSHGESFLSLFQHRFHQRGIYLLDEPEAALSPARQLSLLRIMKDLSATSQFIVATHSPILLGYPDAQIMSFDHNPIQEVKYEDTDHYLITRQFLENRHRVLRHLFDDELEDD